VQSYAKILAVLVATSLIAPDFARAVAPGTPLTVPLIMPTVFTDQAVVAALANFISTWTDSKIFTSRSTNNVRHGTENRPQFGIPRFAVPLFASLATVFKWQRIVRLFRTRHTINFGHALADAIDYFPMEKFRLDIQFEKDVTTATPLKHNDVVKIFRETLGNAFDAQEKGPINVSVKNEGAHAILEAINQGRVATNELRGQFLLAAHDGRAYRLPTGYIVLDVGATPPREAIAMDEASAYAVPLDEIPFIGRLSYGKGLGAHGGYGLGLIWMRNLLRKGDGKITLTSSETTGKPTVTARIELPKKFSVWGGQKRAKETLAFLVSLALPFIGLTAFIYGVAGLFFGLHEAGKNALAFGLLAMPADFLKRGPNKEDGSDLPGAAQPRQTKREAPTTVPFGEWKIEIDKSVPAILRSTRGIVDHQTTAIASALRTHFLEAHPPEEIAHVLSEASGIHVSENELSRHIALRFHDFGNHKWVYKAIFSLKNGKQISVALALAVKSERAAGDISLKESADLEALSGLTPYTPRFVTLFEWDAKKVYLEEFIQGPQVRSLHLPRSGQLPLSIRSAVVTALLEISSLLREVPKDMHEKQFVMRDTEVSAPAVMVDLGDKRIQLDRALLRIVAFYGYFSTDLDNDQNHFIFETYLKVFGNEGLPLLERSLDHIRTMSHGDLRSRKDTSAANPYKHHLREERGEPALTRDDVWKLAVELNRFIQEMRAAQSKRDEKARSIGGSPIRSRLEMPFERDGGSPLSGVRPLTTGAFPTQAAVSKTAAAQDAINPSIPSRTSLISVQYLEQDPFTLAQLFSGHRAHLVFDAGTGNGDWLRQVPGQPWVDSDASIIGFQEGATDLYPYGRSYDEKDSWKGLTVLRKRLDPQYPKQGTVDVLHLGFVDHANTDGSVKVDELLDHYMPLLKPGGVLLFAHNEAYTPSRNALKAIRRRGYLVRKLAAGEVPEDYPRSMWWNDISGRSKNYLIVAIAPGALVQPLENASALRFANISLPILAGLFGLLGTLYAIAQMAKTGHGSAGDATAFLAFPALPRDLATRLVDALRPKRDLRTVLTAA
jgi:hypothetical protein